MNNREKYVKASSIIKPYADFASKVLKEAEKMDQGNRTIAHIGIRKRKPLVAVAATLVLAFALTAVTYATDLGGFKKTVDSWLYGETTKVQVEQVSKYEYLLTYPDGSTRGTGGIVMDGDKERPATPEEIIEKINNEIEVEKNKEGRIILYYHDHVSDITDKIDDQGIAKVKFKDGILATYLTVKWNGDGSYVTATGHFGYDEIE